MSTEPLPLSTYAEALAHLMRHRELPLESVLGSLGLSIEAFYRADAYWNERLREAHRRRKGALAMKFAEAFAGTRQSLGLFGGEAPPPEAPARAPGPAVPTYLQAAPASPPRVTPAVAPPAPVAPPPPVAAPPPAAPAAPPPAATAPQAPAWQPVSQLGGTISVAEQQPSPSLTLPFQQPARAAPTRSPADRAAPRAEGPAQLGRALGARMDIAHFASLNVELAKNPSDRGSVLQRYGLQGADEHRYIAAAFIAQMESDPDLRARYDALVAHYSALIR